MSSIISDICENTITGRELALQGDYETAIEHLREAVHQTDGLIQTINDPDRKGMWRDIKVLIAVECELITKQRQSETESSQGDQGSKGCQSSLGSLASEEAMVSLGDEALLDSVLNMSSLLTMGSMGGLMSLGMRTPGLVDVDCKGGQHSMVCLESLRGKIVQSKGGEGQSGEGGPGFWHKMIGQKSDAKKKKENEGKTSNKAKDQNRKPNKSGNASEAQFKNFEGSAGDKALVDVLEGVRQKELDVKLADIANLEEAKDLLQEAIRLPRLWPRYFTGIRKPGKGPPGTGKTLLAKAVVSLKTGQGQAATFFNVTSATLTSQWLGQSEKLVRLLFQMARHYAPSVIFIDEIDALMRRRGGDNEHEASRRQKNEFLTEMDGLTTDGGRTTQVTVLAATNFPWNLDEGLKRRFEKRIYIPLPTQVGREALLDINLRGIERSPNLDIRAIAQRLDGYSGSDITSVFRDASLMGMRRMTAGLSPDELDGVREEDLIKQPVTYEDFEEAIRKINKTVSAEDLNKFDEWTKEFGSK